jgi:hypothetical protein
MGWGIDGGVVWLIVAFVLIFVVLAIGFSNERRRG